MLRQAAPRPHPLGRQARRSGRVATGREIWLIAGRIRGIKAPQVLRTRKVTLTERDPLATGGSRFRPGKSRRIKRSGRAANQKRRQVLGRGPCTGLATPLTPS